MLNLGLESLGVSTEEVTVTDILQAELASLEAQHESDKAYYDAITTARNIYNYNEVITSLKKHSSAECVAFASDLLGHEVSVEAEKAAAKPGVMQKLGATLMKWWNEFKNFVIRCANWVSEKISKIMTKITALTINGTPSVRFTTTQLDNIAVACEHGIITTPGQAAARFNKLYESIKDTKKIKIDLRKEGTDYLRRLKTAQDALKKLMTSSQSKVTAFITTKGGAEAIRIMQKVNPKVQKMILHDISVITKNLGKVAKVDAADKK